MSNTTKKHSKVEIGFNALIISVLKKEMPSLGNEIEVWIDIKSAFDIIHLFYKIHLRSFQDSLFQEKKFTI